MRIKVFKEKKKILFIVIASLLIYLPVANAVLEAADKAENVQAGRTTGEGIKISYSDHKLFRFGRPASYKDEQLKEIAFPLGGIGTGTISLGGRGNLRDWEIFNRPGKGINFPFTFFAIYVETPQKKVSRVLEGPLPPPYTSGFGYRRPDVPGLPRFRQAVFRGEYPLAEVELTDPELPVKVTLEAFNPFIPGQPEDSGLPVAVLKYHVRNLTDKEIKITLAGSVANPVGYDGEGEFESLFHQFFGSNVNRVIKGPVSGLYFCSKKVQPDSPAYGTLALTTAWPDLTYVSHWVRGEWWDDLQIFWDDFSGDGQLSNLDEESPSPEGRTDVGTLGLKAVVPAGGEVVLPFVISWHYPNFINYFDVVREQRGQLFHPFYSKKFKNAWEVAEYLFKNLESLEQETRAFHQAFFPPRCLIMYSRLFPARQPPSAPPPVSGLMTAGCLPSRAAAIVLVAALSTVRMSGIMPRVWLFFFRSLNALSGRLTSFTMSKKTARWFSAPVCRAEKPTGISSQPLTVSSEESSAFIATGRSAVISISLKNTGRRLKKLWNTPG